MSFLCSCGVWSVQKHFCQILCIALCDKLAVLNVSCLGKCKASEHIVIKTTTEIFVQKENNGNLLRLYAAAVGSYNLGVKKAIN